MAAAQDDEVVRIGDHLRLELVSSPLGYPRKPPVSYSINRLTIEVESSSTGNTRLRGALGKGALRAVPTPWSRLRGHGA